VHLNHRQHGLYDEGDAKQFDRRKTAANTGKGILAVIGAVPYIGAIAAAIALGY